MKTLNQRRCELLKSEKIAVENTGGTTEELRAILKEAFPKDNNLCGGYGLYYKQSYKSESWTGMDVSLDNGYTAHPISWFYEQDEAINQIPEISNMVKPTFNELDSMPVDERVKVLAKLFPIGTIIKDDCYNCEITIESHDHEEFGVVRPNVIWAAGYGYLYYKGKWAEIISSPKAEAPQPTDTRRSEIVQLVAAMTTGVVHDKPYQSHIVSTAIAIQSEIDQQLNAKDWSKSCTCGELSPGETLCCNFCGLPKIDKQVKSE